MSYTKAYNHLQKYKLENRVIEFKLQTSTVAEAAFALGSTEGEIAKSLAFLVSDKPILVIAAGDKKIDNAKFKNEFGVKAKMIPFDEVDNLIGHPAGGVCPFGINEGVSVFLDESLTKYEIVYPACGTHHTAVKLKINELEQASEYIKWVNVCK